MKAWIVYGSVVLIAVCVAVAPAGEPAATIAERNEALRAAFRRHYEPVEFTLEPKAPQVALPVDLETLTNAKQLAGWLRLEAARAQLSANGVVVVNSRAGDLLSTAYDRLKYAKVPVVVTSDSVLHLYHVLFDNALMHIERRVLVEDLTALCSGMLAKASARLRLVGRAGPLVEADRATQAYLSVAFRLLDPSWTPPPEVADLVEREVKLIMAHEGFAMSPLFGYREDYSQYVPRGHYTRGPVLGRYFRTMMWLGRMTFLLKGNTETIRGALVDEVTANRHTMQALLISRDLTGDEALRVRWERVYSVTAFFVGLSDDLTVFDYDEAYRAVRKRTRVKDVTATAFLDGVRAELAKRPLPLIYGGTGGQLVDKLDEAEFIKRLNATTGLRLMGQRFVPDSYVMGRLVNLKYTGDGEPFTMVRSPVGPMRGFPRGLDVMRVLGSERAAAILEREGDTAYEGYTARVGQLRALFDDFGPGEWRQNLYWAWLGSLRTLLAPCGEGYPAFMQTGAYTDKALNTALASWSQLRHDTVLYAKQVYPGAGGMEPPEAKASPEGLVEPVPALYAELVALNAMSLEGLEALGVLPDEVAWRFKRADGILRRLLELSLKELRAEALSQADLQFILEFGETLDEAIGELLPESRRTTIVADVGTNMDTGLALEEATGHVDLMWVVWKTPGGDIIAGAGPVLSHYEFKHPARDRLTDEKWRKKVKRNAPERAPWTKGFRVGK